MNAIYPTRVDLRHQSDAEQMVCDTIAHARTLAALLKPVSDYVDAIGEPTRTLMAALLDGYDVDDLAATLRDVAPKFDGARIRGLEVAAHERNMGVML